MAADKEPIVLKETDGGPILLAPAAFDVVETEHAWQILHDLHNRAIAAPTAFVPELAELMTRQEAAGAFESGIESVLAQLLVLEPDASVVAFGSVCDFADNYGTFDGLESVFFTGLIAAQYQGMELVLDRAQQILDRVGVPDVLGRGAEGTPILDVATSQLVFPGLDGINDPGLAEAIASGDVFGFLEDVTRNAGREWVHAKKIVGDVTEIAGGIAVVLGTGGIGGALGGGSLIVHGASELFDDAKEAWREFGAHPLMPWTQGVGDPPPAGEPETSMGESARMLGHVIIGTARAYEDDFKPHEPPIITWGSGTPAPAPGEDGKKNEKNEKKENNNGGNNNGGANDQSPPADDELKTSPVGDFDVPWPAQGTRRAGAVTGGPGIEHLIGKIEVGCFEMDDIPTLDAAGAFTEAGMFDVYLAEYTESLSVDHEFTIRRADGAELVIAGRSGGEFTIHTTTNEELRVLRTAGRGYLVTDPSGKETALDAALLDTQRSAEAFEIVATRQEGDLANPAVVADTLAIADVMWGLPDHD